MTVTPQRWVCPRCQANNMPEVRRCFRCGTERPAAPVVGTRHPANDAPRRPSHPHAPPSPPLRPAAPQPHSRKNTASVVIAIVVGAILALLLVPLVLRHHSDGASTGARTTGGAPSILSAPLATPTGEPSVTGASGWKETPIREEQPVIQVENSTPDREELSTLVLQSPTGRYELRLTYPSSQLALPADSYRYYLYGLQFRTTGEPDQYGNLVCRKHRLYSLILSRRHEGEERDQDLGD